MRSLQLLISRELKLSTQAIFQPDLTLAAYSIHSIIPIEVKPLILSLVVLGIYFVESVGELLKGLQFLEQPLSSV